MQTRENPPYKGGCPKIGLDRRGGMNQNTPNPGVALRWPHPFSLPIEWGIRGFPRLQPSTTGDTGHPGLAAGKGLRWEVLPLSRGVMINSRGERMTKALEGQRHHNRLRATSGGETRGYRHSHHQTPHAFSGIFACGSGGSPGYGAWPLIKIISFHNNIYFICILTLSCCLI